MSIYENGKFRPYPFNDSLTTIMKGYWVDHITESEDNSLNMISHFPLSKSVIKLSTDTAPRMISYDQLPEHNNNFTFSNYESVPFGNSAITFGIRFPNKRHYQIGMCKKMRLIGCIYLIRNSQKKTKTESSYNYLKRISNFRTCI